MKDFDAKMIELRDESDDPWLQEWIDWARKYRIEKDVEERPDGSVRHTATRFYDRVTGESVPESVAMASYPKKATRAESGGGQ